MTLSVAVKLPILGGSGESVLLLTDSLLTKRGKPHRKNGAKLWKLGPKMGAVFAGNVDIGETTLTRAQQLIYGLGATNLESIVINFQKAIKESYQKGRKTDFILGAVSKRGEGRLFLSRHAEGPDKVFEGTKQVAIGHPDAVAALLSTEPGTGPIYPPPGGHVDPTMVLPQIELIRFQKAIQYGGTTVGFPIQAMLISASGEQTLQQISLESGSDRFKRYTAGPGEVSSEDPQLDARRQRQHPRMNRRRPRCLIRTSPQPIGFSRKVPLWQFSRQDARRLNFHTILFGRPVLDGSSD